MNTENIALIKSCVAHWERMRDCAVKLAEDSEPHMTQDMFFTLKRAIGETYNRTGCALCGVYGRYNTLCAGCPIVGKAGQINCQGTPLDALPRDDMLAFERFAEIADKEIKFLKSLEVEK